MTNLEKYNKVMMRDLKVTEDQLNDEFLAYLRYPKWTSMTHMDIVSDLEEKFLVAFDTLDITEFSTYSKGIEILTRLGVNMNA